MQETPAAFNEYILKNRLQQELYYPYENLALYSYHTGASLKPLAAEESCPVLFRDIGPLAMIWFLEGKLQRLSGPMSPITYMRTCQYQEPYTDYEKIGRLVFFRPLTLAPWHSGNPHIYVARSTKICDSRYIGFVPGHIDLSQAQQMSQEVQDETQWQRLFGKEYQDCRLESLQKLRIFIEDLTTTEKLAQPLRLSFQSSDNKLRQKAREEMNRVEINENDLCAAWHHISEERRAFVRDALQRIVI